MKINEIHIGEMVQTICKQKGYQLTEIADKLHFSKQRLNGWLKKDDWPVKELFTVSELLGYDFVAIFNQPVQSEQKTKVVLQIEVGEDQKDEVLSYIQDNRLFELLKTKPK